MKLIKYLTLLFVIFFVFSTFKLNAVESLQVENSIANYELNETLAQIAPLDKGFLKRMYRKVSEKIRKTRLSIVKKVKRIFSKKKAKKNRTRASLKNRNRNLYNILIFSGLFILVAALFSLLFIYSLISLKLFIILGITLAVLTIVIGLIYFSKRFTIKPNFK